MPVEEQLATIFELLEGGAETTAEVIQFPVDAGATALEGTTTAVQLGNGVATEVSQLTVVEGGSTTTAGVGLLAMDVGAVGMAIAPALGIVAGVGLYNLAPEFWTNVSNSLLNAGQTIGGKVRCFLNGETKQLGVSEETLEIFKDAFLNAGLYAENPEVIIPDDSGFTDVVAPVIRSAQGVASSASQVDLGNGYSIQPYIYTGPYPLVVTRFYCSTNERHYLLVTSNSSFRVGLRTPDGWSTSGSSTSFTYDNKVVHYLRMWLQGDAINDVTIEWSAEQPLGNLDSFIKYMAWCLWYGVQPNPNLLPDATYPTEAPIPQTYPTWTPWNVPIEGFPDVYPIECPAINDDPNQSEAQNPSALPDNNPDLLPWLINTFPQPEPNPNPYPEPSVNPDPDPAPEPEPIPEPEPEQSPENPIDPNPTPTPSPLPIIPDLPDTVESNAMFTVYKPSMAQVNSFGGWLWSSSIVEAIKRIWQNPLDGIISFMKVYVDAPTSGSDTIKVGMLDSEVSAPVVSSQFVTVECGSLNVSEKFYNATDYSPFVSMHLYLPFIGIVELDIDEFMSGEIGITYHVDVYTGTCLAEVKSRRSPDMPNWTIVYTFSGNASQQLPLTSAEFSGALSSLVGVVGGGLAIASGGGLGVLGGVTGMAHAVTHEMVHLAHSGSLSANAGIMGARKPYLILTRRRGYDANGYNELYGYPSNKTVFLNNCSGYVKIKDIRLETSATDSERLEIENLLKAGVII